MACIKPHNAKKTLPKLTQCYKTDRHLAVAINPARSSTSVQLPGLPQQARAVGDGPEDKGSRNCPASSNKEPRDTDGESS